MAESTQKYHAHETVYIDEPVDIGAGTAIWHFSHIRSGVKIGDNCVIGQNCYLDADVEIGNNVHLQNNVSVYQRVTLEDDVFCGPSMVFTNDINPRAAYHKSGPEEYLPTFVRRGASIGANATIVCGVTIGRHAFIGAGAVVTRDVPDYAVMHGVPARLKGWMCECGTVLNFEAINKPAASSAEKEGRQQAVCTQCGRLYEKYNNHVHCIERTTNVSSIQVPQLDLVAEYRSIQSEVDAAMQRVLESGMFIMGGEVKAFEEEMAEYLGVKHVIGVGNGTDALQVAYMTLGLQPGDEIITTPFTFIATVETMAVLKLKPVFVDIDWDSFALDPSKIEAAITERTRAIVPIHLYGQCADMDAILAIAKKHKLAVIEDAAQAIGATYKGKQAGTMGDFGTFSFFPSKNLGAYGDGGMVVTNDDELAERARMIRVHGTPSKYDHIILGINSRLDALQAAILRVKLKHIEKWNAKRREIAGKYDQMLAGSDILTPRELADCHHIYHQYTIRSEQRDDLQKFLADSGVSCGIHYPIALHQQRALQFLGYNTGDFPMSERAAAQVMSLPIFPQLSDAQIQKVAETILEFKN